jgi:hypothetical protein
MWTDLLPIGIFAISIFVMMGAGLIISHWANKKDAQNQQNYWQRNLWRE